MRSHCLISRRNQRGVVLLMALMALLLISAVAAALLFMTSMESSLVGYQRANTRAYEAALGGLEEGRARLSTNDPSFLGGATFSITFPNAVGHALYIVNPKPAAEFTLANVRNAASPFYDWEYDREWGAGALAAATVVNPTPPPAAPLNSDMVALAAIVGGAQPLPEIAYKWVRVTILTEQAANRDIDGDAALNNIIPVTWDSHSNRMNINVNPAALVDRGGGVFEPLDTNGNGIVSPKERLGRYVYRITALSRVASTGATRMVQYDVSAPFLNLGFPAAISLIGTGSQCGDGPGVCNPGAMPDFCDSPTDFGPSNSLRSHGQDQAPGATPGDGGPAIGCTDPNTCTDCVNELSNDMRTANWTGNGGTSATGTGNITASAGALTTTSGLESMINSIKALADQTYSAADTPPQTDGNAANDTIPVPAAGTMGVCDATINMPKVTVFDGDVAMGNAGGCGVLLVTGSLSVTGSWSWKGLVLVLGEGNFDAVGTESLQGAQVIARIYCKDGDAAPCPCAVVNANCVAPGVLANPADAVLRFNGGGTGGWDYNSMYINNAFGSGSYRVLAYREMTR